MVDEKQLKRFSKFLSWTLRHHPETVGIELDEHGWTDVDLLLEKSKAYGIDINFPLLVQIVETNKKKRFSFDPTLTKIRASQGHSVEINIGYLNTEPPEILFHGTGRKYVESILASGLMKQSRQHVHLSTDIETAIKVGQRHGKPCVFKISARKMFADHYQFYLSDNGVWLTETVPTKYLIAD